MADKKLLPDAKVCERYGVCGSTLWRWDHNPGIGFPAPVIINGRKYRDASELDAWDDRVRKNSTTRHNAVDLAGPAQSAALNAATQPHPR